MSPFSSRCRARKPQDETEQCKHEQRDEQRSDDQTAAHGYAVAVAGCTPAGT